MKPPSPPNEAARLQSLRAYGILDTPAERAYEDIVALAAAVCGTPVALVSLVDEQRQWFKARRGLEVGETPRDEAFCAHAILEPGKLLQVPDAARDARFAANPLVTGGLRLRFYAGAPLVAPGGEALGTLCVLDREPRELTAGQRQSLEALSRMVVAQLELRRRNAELARLHGTKSIFVSNVGHELRTPITAIQGSIGLMLAGAAGELPPEARRLLGIADASCGRLTRLLDDVLDIEKISSGRMELRLSDCDLPALARQVMDRLSTAAAARSVDLRLDRTPSRAAARADPALVAQVLDNLMANAIRHSPSGAAVEVAIEARGPGHLVAVRDHGPGVAPQFRAQLFESFSPASIQGPRGPDSTGLGLALCKSIVERLGGTIGFEPAEGGGARFFFELPASQAN